MDITEIQSAANDGDIDKIYELIEAASPTDAEREQLQAIALEHVEANPEVAVAVTLGTSEEFGQEIYKTLLKNNQTAAARAMSDGEIPGYDIPVEDVLLLVAEHCSPEIWDFVMIGRDPLEESIAKLIGAAAALAAEKNQPLYEKLIGASWIWENIDGNDGRGGVGVLAAIYSTPEDFKKVISTYQPDLSECAVAAAETGRIDNLQVIADTGYDLSRYPCDPDYGTLADIAFIRDQAEATQWLIARGVKRDFSG